MIIESQQIHTRLFHSYERQPRRRYHTLDNATLDQFNFICVPLHPKETRVNISSSHSNLTEKSTNEFSIPKPSGLSSPTRRVRFKFDVNDNNKSLNSQYVRSSEDVRSSKQYSTHRVEFQIPVNRDSWINIDPLSLSSKARAITSKKIDINYSDNNNNHNHNNTRQPSDRTLLIDSPIPPTAESYKNQTQWYKEMYCKIHKSPENKKDVILVKLPPTPPRYREYYQQLDGQANPYQPTYTFPEEYESNLERMEDYMRKAASQNIDDDYKNLSSSPVRTSTTLITDRKTIPKQTTDRITRLEDQFSPSSVSKSSNEKVKLINDVSTSSIMNNSRSNTNYNHISSSTADDEQKSIYKRILRGGEIPSAGLQKISANNREKSNESYEYHEKDDLLELNRQNLRSQTNDSQPIYKALALHNFYAETDRELSFKKGDTIVVKRRINDDWLEGERQGSTGIFPLNHVELFPYEINEEETTNENEQQIEGEAIAKYDFVPEKTYELQLKKGNKVTLLRKLDNNWYEGRVNHSEGIFPAEYVETLREPKERSLKQSYNTETTAKPTKMPKSVLKNPTRSSPIAIEKSTVTPELSLPLQKCQVLYDYTPQNPDELEIHVGDIISIIEICDDGWYCGLMEKSNYGKTMEFGTFPGNYVKILPAEKQ